MNLKCCSSDYLRHIFLSINFLTVPNNPEIQHLKLKTLFYIEKNIFKYFTI